MKAITFEATIVNGQIKLVDSITLPEHLRVLVVVPEGLPARPLQNRSPRLVNPDDAADFIKEVTEDTSDE